MKKPSGAGCNECEEWTEERGCGQCFWASKFVSTLKSHAHKHYIDSELRDKLVSWLTDIADRADHLTSGNVAHNKAYISGVAHRAAEYVTKHSVELKEE